MRRLRTIRARFKVTAEFYLCQSSTLNSGPQLLKRLRSPLLGLKAAKTSGSELLSRWRGRLKGSLSLMSIRWRTLSCLKALCFTTQRMSSSLSQSWGFPNILESCRSPGLRDSHRCSRTLGCLETPHPMRCMSVALLPLISVRKSTQIPR